MFAQVVLDLPIEIIFSYKIPMELQSQLKIGQGVEVPFRNHFRSGIVVNIKEELPSFIGELKEIRKILNLDWHLPQDLLKLTRWISVTKVTHYFYGDSTSGYK